MKESSNQRWLRLLAAMLFALVFGFACQRQSAAVAKPAASAEENVMRELLKHYFETWSARDITAYGECFNPHAQIWYASYPALGLSAFLETQRRAHLQSTAPMTEDPLEIDVTIHNGMAHAQVHWALHNGTENVRGYDFFTLVKFEGRWQIMALVFNEEKP